MDVSAMSGRIAAILLLICVTGALLPATLSAQSRGDAATAGEPADDAGWGEMTPERREEALAYSRTRDVFYFVTTAYAVVVLLVILYTGFSARLLAWAERLARKRFAGMIIYLAMFVALMGIMVFPFEYYLGFHLEHTYGLSHQSFGAWMGDQMKGLAILLVLLTIVVGILYSLIRRHPRTWWLWFGAASVPLLIVLVILSPILITPLFYDVTEMDDTPLKTQILSLASASGIDESRVFVMDASKNTNRLNAYVTGLRGTKRIVLYDNLIARMAPAEVLFVVGHEMGHYLKHHIWLGLGVAVMLIFVFSYLAHRLMGGIIHAHQRRLGFDRLSSFASLPLFYLAAIIFGFVCAPVQNAISRSLERSADAFGMAMTGDGEAAARAFEKLADVNLANPDPSLFIKLWRYSHPPLSERVRYVRASAGRQSGGGGAAGAGGDSLRIDGERHLSNIRQLTFGGENAEAYFNFRGDQLVFQSTRDDWPCDRIFTMGLNGENVRQVSVPGGVTTCAFWAPDGERIIYASTYLVHDSCPPKPDYSLGYVWPLHRGYDVFSCKPDGSDLKRLTDTPGYDAEAVYSPDGSRILFTSVRDGDLELYTMDSDGGNVTRLTHAVGYDGGAFFSVDGKKIVFRAHRPADSAEIADYQHLLLEKAMIRPSRLEIFVMDADGSNIVQVTSNGAANFCPYFHPNGRQIIFSSNQDDPEGHNFDLFLISIDGTGLERVTYADEFDGFPMFNREGTKLVWCSNRFSSRPGETNTFIADWTD